MDEFTNSVKKLTVRMNGRDLIIDLDINKSTIKDLKLAVFEKFGIPVDQQVYSYEIKPPHFKELNDDVPTSEAFPLPEMIVLHLSFRDHTLQWCVFSVYDGRSSKRIGPRMFKFHKLDTVLDVKRKILTKCEMKRGAQIENLELTHNGKVWEDHQNLFQCQTNEMVEIKSEGDAPE